MKDLTDYFVDAVKSSENSVETASEVIEELQTNVNENTDQVNKKRSRVKIKITKSNSQGKICKIINSKDDLIDKTPSPSPTSSRKTRGQSNLNEIPNNSNSNNKIKYDEETKKINLDLSFENIFSPPKRKNSLITPVNISNNQMAVVKEESNAFQILMTRDKPIKNIFTNLLASDKSIDEIKDNDDIVSKFKKTKGKLVSADNRIHSKRKFNDKEEEIIIEEELKNRTKLFKRNSTDNIQNNSISQNQRISTPQGFHSYFTKIVAEEKENPQEKDQLNLVDVESNEINGSESTENCDKLKNNKLERKTKNSRSRRNFETIDNDQNSKTIDLNSSIIVHEQESNNLVRNHPRKRRWSLRINLPLSDDDSDSVTKKSSINGNGNNNDLLFGKKMKSKEKLKKHDPEKEKKRKINKTSEIITKSTSSESDDMKNKTNIEIIESKVFKRPPNEKLAPLFVKRPKPDPNVIAARQLFLHSRSPEKERKKLEKINKNSKKFSLLFPTISHVTQIEKTESISIANLKYCFKESTSTYHPTLNIADFKSVINLNNSTLIKTSKLNNSMKQDCDLEEVLKEMEKQCTDVREMWAKISAIANKQNNNVSPKRRGRKKKSVDSGIAGAVEMNNQNDVWTEKYKPLNTKEIIGNEEAVLKLKNWLNSWTLSTNYDDYSSSEEFYNSDNSRSSIAQNNQQVAVLLGPHGSGKTVSVYAIAEELGFNVLEVNASSKRPGRKILKDLDEATKSHRVKDSNLKSIFQPTNSDDNKKVQKNSLILFEDVDIIFDEDEGFISAVYQLASNTKRPIVMTCRNSCTHLSRMAPQQLKIYFQATEGSRALAFLDLISLAEAGTRLPRSCLDKLLINGDLRKALLQLQYLIASEAPSTSLSSNDFRETLWQDMRNYLYKPTIKLGKRIKQKNKAASNANQINDQDTNDKNIIHHLANDLDIISIISSLVDVNDSTLNVSQLQFEPSLSLEENMSYYSSSHVRNMEIGEWLRHQTMSKYTSDVDVDHSKALKQLLLKKELNIGVDIALSQISMHTLDSRIMAVDYLPTTRTICRAEELKSTNNTKRGNRFFHYLHNFRLPSGSLKPNVLAAACKVMQEKL